MNFEEAVLSFGRPNTVRTKISLFKTHIKDQVNPDGNNLNLIIQQWVQTLSTNTILSLLSITKEYIKWSSNTIIDTRKYTQITTRYKQKNKLNTLTKKQTENLITYCQRYDQMLYLPLILALHTGMRKGEVFGLEWRDINFRKKTIMISRTYKNSPTKNGRSRIITLSNYLSLFLQDKISNPKDKVIKKTFNPNYRLKNACYNLNIPIITFHTLRHIFATLALESNQSPKLVQEALGHSKLSTTLDIYWDSIYKEMDLGFLPTGRTM